MSADVAALFPSINIKQGLDALNRLFMEHTTFPEYLRRFFLDLAHFVLGNDYVECQELEGPIMVLQEWGAVRGKPFQ